MNTALVQMKSTKTPVEVGQSVYKHAAEYGIDINSINTHSVIDGYTYFIGVAYEDHHKFSRFLDEIGDADLYDTITADRTVVDNLFNEYIALSDKYGPGVVNEVLRLAMACYDCADAYHQSDDADIIESIAFRYGTEDDLDVTQALSLVTAASTVDSIDAIIKSAAAKGITIDHDDYDAIASYLIGSIPGLDECDVDGEFTYEPKPKPKDTDSDKEPTCSNCGRKCYEKETETPNEDDTSPFVSAFGGFEHRRAILENLLNELRDRDPRYKAGEYRIGHGVDDTLGQINRHFIPNSAIKAVIGAIKNTGVDVIILASE